MSESESVDRTRVAAEAHAATVEEVIRQRLSAAVGGWRGSVETAIPTIAFVIAWTVTQDLRTSILASAVMVVVLGLIRVVQRQTLQYVVSAAFATLLKRRRSLRGLCPTCRYDLRGLPPGTPCPECGPQPQRVSTKA
mgnify:CR=1 FL=1